MKVFVKWYITILLRTISTAVEPSGVNVINMLIRSFYTHKCSGAQLLTLLVHSTRSYPNFYAVCSIPGVHNSNLMVGQIFFWHIQGLIIFNTFKGVFIKETSKINKILGFVDQLRSTGAKAAYRTLLQLTPGAITNEESITLNCVKVFGAANLSSCGFNMIEWAISRPKLI